MLTIEKELAAGNATEHTHRPALKTLVEGLIKGVTATNEPQRTGCGAPDFLVTKGASQVGYIEAKDVGKSLDEAEKSEQLKRYRDSLPNIILTDYLEFRWYVNGELHRPAASLGTPTKNGKIKRNKVGVQAVAELLNDFLAHKAEAVGTPKELAKRMARLAHRLRELVTAAFQKKLNLPSLSNLYKAFCDTLVPDLTTEQFADMYAQTIAYGLFAARCNSPNGTTFTRQYARDLVPKTNPFLCNIFDHIAGAGLPEILAPEVDDLVQLLAQADMASVLKDFGKRTAKEDPVVHFYETFLAEYDPKVREMRGVYYTPEPVVSYIVRSIDHLLKTHFDKPQGLADPSVLVLDPAVGTATFLYMVINEIHDVLLSQGQAGLWNEYVAEKLLPRIFGFELLMAPYAMAHLKLELLLKETGYQFEKEQRLGIYLTNTLEEAVKHSEALFANWITEEANAAAEIKKDKPIMVVLGNPPYSGISANKGEWITKLIEDYKQVDGKALGERKAWLQNDYVKFIRFGQWRIERTGQGILGFITDHSYLDSPTFRGMRQALINTFTEIYILDLHGDAKRRETTPDGSKDENVFDITQGVVITLFVKEPKKCGPVRIHHADLWGLRGDWPNPQQKTKYYMLAETDIASTDWAELKPNSPFYFFVPRNEELRPEYEQGWKVTDIFPMKSVGAMSGHDFFIMSHDLNELERRVSFLSGPASDYEVTEKYGLCDHQNWRLSNARQQLKQDEEWKSSFIQILYRPFDYRFTFYSDYMFARSLDRYLCHMLHNNLSLCIGRAGQVVGKETWDIAFCSKGITDLNLFYRGGNVNLPLYLYPVKGEMEFAEGHRRPNLNPEFIKAVSNKLKLNFVEDGKGNLEETFGPEDIFNYAYAVFHSPTYRSRYAEFLKIDFPRLPLTSDKGLFKALVATGAELVSLHLMEYPKLDNLITKYPIVGPSQVETVRYDEANQRVYINKSQYFEGIPLEIWNFHIGGYQVCQKWLKDRKGRPLTFDDSFHYQKIIVALKETIRLMGEIDTLIPTWPLQ
jgi:predicted helicase